MLFYSLPFYIFPWDCLGKKNMFSYFFEKNGDGLCRKYVMKDGLYKWGKFLA